MVHSQHGMQGTMGIPSRREALLLPGLGPSTPLECNSFPIMPHRPWPRMMGPVVQPLCRGAPELFHPLPSRRKRGERARPAEAGAGGGRLLLGGRKGRGRLLLGGQKGAGPGTSEVGAPSPGLPSLEHGGSPEEEQPAQLYLFLQRQPPPPALRAAKLSPRPPSHKPRPTAVNRSPAGQTAPLRAAPLRRRRRQSASDVTRPDEAEREGGKQQGNVPCGPKGKGAEEKGPPLSYAGVSVRARVWQRRRERRLDAKRRGGCG